MALAIFDLDNTLLAGDSDYLWGIWLSEQGVVDRAQYERDNDRFYQEYKEGRLDIQEFLAFALRPLSQHPAPQLLAWRQRFMEEKIEPIVLAAGLDLLERHRAAGDTLVIITATNSFVTAPIAARLGVPHLLATEPEWRDGRYTGAVTGIPCFQTGKVTRLQEWLKTRPETLHGSSFYSDSHNDLPLLELVSHPVAVDPDAILAGQAEARGWPCISLRS